jgi:transcriptional regulator with XRE-family HTH domain
MGKYPRRKQEHLAEKLLQIRRTFDISQNEMLRRLGLDDALARTNISNYELDQREPPIYVLLQYARLAGICLDVLCDDELTLPTALPSTHTHSGMKIGTAKRPGSKK